MALESPPQSQARVGAALLGGTRLGFFDLTTHLLINDVDKTTELLWQHLEWIERISNAPDIVRFRLRSTTEPSLGHTVKLGLGSATSLVFGGPLVRCAVTNPHPASDAAAREYVCEAMDFTRLLNRERVIGRYTGSADAIVTALIADFATGFTTTNVATGGPTVTGGIEFKYVPLGEALNRVAERAGWVWRVDADKDVHFYDPTVGEGLQSAQPLVEPNASFWAERHELDDAQVRTMAIVEGYGSKVVTTAVTAGDTSITVEDEANHQQLLDDGYSGIGVIGVDEFTFTGTSSGSITGIPASGAGSIGNNWPIGAEVNIIVKKTDSAAATARAAIEGDDGLHQVYVQDRRLAPDSADARCQQELDRWSVALIQGSYMTRERFARAGRDVNITLVTGHGIASHDSTIQEVSVKWLVRDLADRTVRYGPAATARTLVQMLKQSKLESLEVS